MNHYSLTLKFEEYRPWKNLTQVLRGDHFIAEREVLAPDRQTAVRDALHWFSTCFKDKVGPAWKVLTVDDPFREVTYDRNFDCHDLRNQFLPEEVVERLLVEANGELVRQTDHGAQLSFRRRLPGDTQAQDDRAVPPAEQTRGDCRAQPPVAAAPAAAAGVTRETSAAPRAVGPHPTGSRARR